MLAVVWHYEALESKQAVFLAPLSFFLFQVTLNLTVWSGTVDCLVAQSLLTCDDTGILCHYLYYDFIITFKLGFEVLVNQYYGVKFTWNEIQINER